MQVLRSLVRQDCHLSLGEDLPVIDRCVDVVNCAAGHCFASDKGLLPSLESWKFRQKRWVNVDNTTRKRLQHWFVQDAHETGENDKFDTGVAQHIHELLFYFRLQTGTKSARRQIRIDHTKLPRNIQNRRIQNIRKHEPGFRSEIARPDAIEDRAAVSSLTGPENSNWQVFHSKSAVV